MVFLFFIMDVNTETHQNIDSLHFNLNDDILINFFKSILNTTL